MGTVKGGQRWTGAAVQGQAVAGLARAGQVFHRGAGDEPTPTGEIWYADFNTNSIVRERPTTTAFLHLDNASDDFEIFSSPDWSEVFIGSHDYGANVANIMSDRWIHGIYGLIFFMTNSGQVRELLFCPPSARPFIGKRVTMRFTVDFAARIQNGDMWFEVED